MGIAVTCTKCNASFRVKDEHAGKRGKCPRCKTVLQIPQAAEAAEEETAGLVVLPDEAETTAEAKLVEEPAGGADGTRSVPATSAAGAGADGTRSVPATAAADGLALGEPASAPSAPELPDQRQLTPQQLQQLQQKILGAFQAQIEPVDVPITYGLGALLVAVVMVILPLVYVGFIVAVGYLVYLHAVHDTAIVGAGGSGRGAFVAILVYVAPMIIGGILVVFMIKPLFARPAKQGRTRSLTRDGEPLLFAFVDRVCEAVGAPRPRRIDVDCQVNASASFRRGLWSMLGSDLVLTVGMPLAAGLDLRQFAGVLGHEFGHFTQGAGMRLTYVIRSISWWFTRVVYERDAWDEKLIELAKSLDLRISWVLHLARLLVWLTRKVLWVLMIVGHAVSGYMLRQMEFDADRHEARLAGSDTFEATARRLLVLNVAMEGAQADLGEFYREGRLGDNLPRLIMANVRQIPEELYKKLNEHIDKSQTGAFDTHPADKDRIASARRENTPGVFRLGQPATLLFRDFETLSRNVTWDFYRGIFGPQFKPTDMHPTDDLLVRQGREQEAHKALARYFQGSFTTLRPLGLPGGELSAPGDPGGCAAALKQSREKMLEARPAFEEAYKEYDKADTHTIEADQAAVLLKANFTVRPTDFSVPMSSKNTAAGVRRNAVARQNQLSAQMAGLEQSAGRRLVAALRLLFVPKVAARIDGAEGLQQECNRIFSSLVFLNRQHKALLELRNAHASLAILLGNIEGNEENQSLINSIRSQAEKVLVQVRSLHTALMGGSYPLDHAKGDITIAQYALEKIPMSEDLGGIYGAGEEMLDKLPPLYARLAGRLVVVAEQVEQVLGLPPLPEPEKKEEEEAESS